LRAIGAAHAGNPIELRGELELAPDARDMEPDGAVSRHRDQMQENAAEAEADEESVHAISFQVRIGLEHRLVDRRSAVFHAFGAADTGKSIENRARGNRLTLVQASLSRQFKKGNSGAPVL
jgi:hypothetical protein